MTPPPHTPNHGTQDPTPRATPSAENPAPTHYHNHCAHTTQGASSASIVPSPHEVRTPERAELRERMILAPQPQTKPTAPPPHEVRTPVRAELGSPSKDHEETLHHDTTAKPNNPLPLRTRCSHLSARSWGDQEVQGASRQPRHHDALSAALNPLAMRRH